MPAINILANLFVTLYYYNTPKGHAEINVPSFTAFIVPSCPAFTPRVTIATVPEMT